MKNYHHSGTDVFIVGLSLSAFFMLLAEHTSFGIQHGFAFGIANLLVWSCYVLAVAFDFAAAPNKRRHLKEHWFEVLVIWPLIQCTVWAGHLSVYTMTRQLALLVMLLSRVSRMRGLMQLLAMKPAQLMFSGFAGTIGVGAVLLMLPAATVSGDRLPFIDALFTATSAVCVTGLAVLDTGTTFSLFGQAVIAALIQVGGLGIMTFSVALTVLLRKPMGLREQAVLQNALDHDTIAGVQSLIRFIVLMTLSIEMAGAVLLFSAWHGRFDSLPSAVWASVFHSISAFCNAGFSTFSDSLMGFRNHAGVNAVICGLIISGGLGFMVIRDFILRFRCSAESRAGVRLRVQTKIVLTMTLVLILSGAAMIYIAERSGLLGDMSPREAAMSSLFQSVTARTAGFNTLDIGKLSSAALFMIIVLMFIGASPGSTAGGIKTTTVAVLWAALVASFRNRPHVEIFRRTLPVDAVFKALAVLCIALLLVAVFTYALLCVEDQPFMSVLFEAVSAFGTVGLSTGITPLLSEKGKLLIIVLMFIGRLGPMTIVYAMLPRRRPVRYKYAVERMMIS